ncbi:hypothetical protein BC833DRAFT_600779 [Globomyces pollinis-pini]|nr:hypothetical protein BC833DRAFT_600779 [Globomyces pollinis-pini]
MQWIHVLALSVRGCEFTTHNEVVHQAQFFFKDSNRSGIYSNILKDYSPYLQAGSFFPDWGYACGNASEAAEIAHWPIFWNAGVEYINKTYTKPYNSKAKSLIAFLFGTVSHGVADVLWHSLGIDQGLIRVMQHTEFDGSYASAHTIADIGGEFVLSRLGKLKYLEKYWKFPTDDIINIYASLGFTVSFADFNLCMMQGYVGTQANQALGRYFYPIPARQSRFLTENYFTYFRGGVHSMAVSVNQCWKELINWLERGELTTACLPFKSVSYSRAKTNIQVSPNDSSQNCNEFSRNWVMKLLEKGSTSIRAGPSVLLQGMCMVLRSRVLSQQQSRMELFKNMINISFQNVISNLREFFHRMADPTVSASNQTTVLYTDMDYAMLGASVANGDFNGDGIKELVVGSPGYSDINFPQCGAIFYFPNGVSKRTAYDNIDGVAKMIVGPKGFSNQFGYSIAAVDLNHDGIDDLAISAPFYGGKDDDFSGAVFVLFGKKGVGLRLDGAWDMIIYGLKDTNNSSATQNFEVFGHILKGIDVNDDGFQDLVVGSPFTSNKAGTQVGKFQVFLSKIGYSSQMTSDDSSWTIYGSQDYEWFGMDFSKIDDQICVGSPGYNTYDIPQSGKVSCFKLPNGNTVRPSLQYEILSSEKFAQFGW